MVVDTAGDTETDSVLKGVVRAERLENPEDYVDALRGQVKPEHIAAQYNLPKDSWKDSLELLEKMARKAGRLLKGGDPCLRSSAITLINDFQRGRLPHYVAPPELKEEEEAKPEETATVEGVKTEEQDLDVEKGEHEEDDNAAEEEADDEQEEQGEEVKKNDEKEESSDSEDEEEAPTTNLIGAGEWED